MNRYQRLIVVVATIDVLLMMLFPPFNDSPLAKGTPPSFEGFYPLIGHFGVKAINTDLLTIELMFVAANLLAAFLCLASRGKEIGGDEPPAFRFELGIAVFVAANLAIVLLFPPFEPYNSLSRGNFPSFDSFYFLWGNRSARPIFAPMLYLEVIFVVVNALLVWLLFNALRRGEAATRTRLLALAETMDEKELAQLTEAMRNRVRAHHLDLTLARLGRGEERRRDRPVAYAGAERRRQNRRQRVAE